MRTIGQGASSAKRFCGVMNMPPPPKPNAYHRHNKALVIASMAVACETMLEAGTEIHEHKGNSNADGISQCGVSCDGTWQKRGHSSMNGCVTALSMDTGKCLDVEVFTRYAMDAKDMKTNRTQEKIEYGKQSMQGNARQTILDQHHPWKLRV